jgi:hypothetical protein
MIKKKEKKLGGFMSNLRNLNPPWQYQNVSNRYIQNKKNGGIKNKN